MGPHEFECVFIWGMSEKATRVLNEYARDGWELVTVFWCYHYLRRSLA